MNEETVNPKEGLLELAKKINIRIGYSPVNDFLLYPVTDFVCDEIPETKFKKGTKGEFIEDPLTNRLVANSDKEDTVKRVPKKYQEAIIVAHPVHMDVSKNGMYIGRMVIFDLHLCKPYQYDKGILVAPYMAIFALKHGDKKE